jgi:Cadherin domain
VVTVLNVDEHDVGSLVDVDPAENWIVENLNNREVGIRVRAIDNDRLTDSVTYSLADNDGGRFTIHATTGVVKTAMPLDRETDGPTRTIVVVATSSDGSTISQAFSINIEDISETGITAIVDLDGGAVSPNEVNETKSPEEYGADDPFQIFELTLDGRLIPRKANVGITAFASDADATAIVRYSLDDSEGGLFEIDPETGVVQAAVTLDFEDPTRGPDYTIIVRATSSDGATVVKSFLIRVINLPELGNYPQPTPGAPGTPNLFKVEWITDSNSARNAIAENATNGTVVQVTAAAIDADQTNNTITYSLTDSAGGRFAIHATTGVVTRTGVTIDRESAEAYNITVKATSSDASFATRVFRIEIDDVNEWAVSSVGIVNRLATIKPGMERWAYIGRVKYSMNSGPGIYTITTGDDRFIVENSTGIVRLRRPDLVSLNDIYSLGISYSSPETGTILDQTLTVFVASEAEIYENDVAYLTVKIPKITNAGTVVPYRTYALDRDATNNVITYSLTSNPGSLFAINATTGVITTTGALSASTTYSITIRAESSDVSSATRTISIGTLSNDSDAIVLSPATQSLELLESTATGVSLGLTVSALDAAKPTRKYTFTLRDGHDIFAINPTTGDLTLAKPLDFESKQRYSIVVRATAEDDETCTARVSPAKLYAESLGRRFPNPYNPSLTTSVKRFEESINRTATNSQTLPVYDAFGTLVNTYYIDKEYDIQGITFQFEQIAIEVNELKVEIRRLDSVYSMRLTAELSFGGAIALVWQGEASYSIVWRLGSGPSTTRESCSNNTLPFAVSTAIECARTFDGDMPFNYLGTSAATAWLPLVAFSELDDWKTLAVVTGGSKYVHHGAKDATIATTFVAATNTGGSFNPGGFDGFTPCNATTIGTPFACVDAGLTGFGPTPLTTTSIATIRMRVLP